MANSSDEIQPQENRPQAENVRSTGTRAEESRSSAEAEEPKARDYVQEYCNSRNFPSNLTSSLSESCVERARKAREKFRERWKLIESTTRASGKGAKDLSKAEKKKRRLANNRQSASICNAYRAILHKELLFSLAEACSEHRGLRTELSNVRAQVATMQREIAELRAIVARFTRDSELNVSEIQPANVPTTGTALPANFENDNGIDVVSQRESIARPEMTHNLEELRAVIGISDLGDQGGEEGVVNPLDYLLRSDADEPPRSQDEPPRSQDEER